MIEIGANTEAVEEALRRLQEKGKDLSLPFADIGEYLLLAHNQRWRKMESPDGEAWAPLTEAYKKRKPQNQDKILVLYGYLGQLDYQVSADRLVFGTGLAAKDYAATHQYGDDSRGIPARPFLGISSEDERVVLELLSDYFIGD